MIDYSKMLKIKGRPYLEKLCLESKRNRTPVKYARIVSALEGDPSGVDTKLFENGIRAIYKAEDKSGFKNKKSQSNPSKLEMSLDFSKIGKRLEEIYDLSGLEFYPEPVRKLLKDEGVENFRFGGRKWDIINAPKAIVCDFARSLMKGYQN